MIERRPLRGLPVRGGLRPGPWTARRRSRRPTSCGPSRARRWPDDPPARSFVRGRSARCGLVAVHRSVLRPTRSRLRNSRVPALALGRGPRGEHLRDLYECWLGDEIVPARAPALGRDSLPRFAEEPGIRSLHIQLWTAGVPAPWPSGISRPAPSGLIRSARAWFLTSALLSFPPGAHPSRSSSPSPRRSWRASCGSSAPDRGLLDRDERALGGGPDLGGAARTSRWRTSAIRSRARGNQSSTSRSPCPGPRRARAGHRPPQRLPERVGSAINESTTSPPTRLTSSGRRRRPPVHAGSLSRERDPGEYRESEQTALKITTQLERLVGRLLELARSAPPSAVVRPSASSSELALETGPLQRRRRGRGVLLEISIDPGLQITSDRYLLGESSRTSWRTSATTRTRAPWCASRRRRRGLRRVVENAALDSTRSWCATRSTPSAVG